MVELRGLPRHRRARHQNGGADELFFDVVEQATTLALTSDTFPNRYNGEFRHPPRLLALAAKQANLVRCSLSQGPSSAPPNLPLPDRRSGQPPAARWPPTPANRPLPPCRAIVAQDCISSYNELKLSKKYKFIIFKLSDDNKQIVVEEASDSPDWEVFREKLVNAQTKSKSVSFPLVLEHLSDAVGRCLRCASGAAGAREQWLTGLRALSARAPGTPSTTLSTSLPRARVPGTI
ncbi:hypothetical protein IMZ48_01860 [Candidatus Bathyarchaeota archaeon]|nr:hypothetical protein [Candidatus Bathyarchaeota archaeon]